MSVFGAMFQRVSVSKLQLATSSLKNVNVRMMSAYSDYKSLNVTTPEAHVVSVELNRPEKMNAMNETLWGEIGDVFRKIDKDPDARVVLLSAAGKMFTSGIDLSDLTKLASVIYGEDDIARKNLTFYNQVLWYQDQFTDIERCKKPVIACIHNACVGGGVDLITATDIRLGTVDSWFCVKEVDMGLAADVGTLQRLPKVIGNQSLVNELCLTARKMKSDEAVSCGLISRTYADKEEMMKNAIELAKLIAAKSPVAVQGTKMHLVYSREHTVAEGLRNMSTWNMSMLQSEDVMKSAMASMNKDESPEFSNF